MELTTMEKCLRRARHLIDNKNEQKKQRLRAKLSEHIEVTRLGGDHAKQNEAVDMAKHALKKCPTQAVHKFHLDLNKKT